MITMKIERNHGLMLLGGVVVLGAILRFWDLGADSIWYDEAASLAQSSGTFFEVFARTAQDNYPPLHNVLLYLSMNFFGQSEWAIRLPSALLGIANIVALYALTSRFGGRGAGLLAALMLALSGFHIWYSHEGRMYTLLAFTATAFAWALVSSLMQPKRHSSWILWLAGTALLYSHPFGLLNWGAILLGAFIASKISASFWTRPLLTIWRSQALVLLAFLPWVLVLVLRAAKIGTTGFWIERPTMKTLAYILYSIGTGPVAMSFVAAGIILALASAAGRLRRTPVDVSWGAAAFLITWAVAPLVIAFAGSLVVTPFITNRYLIASLPAILCLSALGFSKLGGGLRAFYACAVTAVVASTVGIIYASPPLHSQWREVTAYASSKINSKLDCIIVSPKTNAMPVAYYLGSNGCAVGVGEPADLEGVPISRDRAVVILDTAGGPSDEYVVSKFQGWATQRKVFDDLTVYVFTVSEAQRQTLVQQ